MPRRILGHFCLESGDHHRLEEAGPGGGGAGRRLVSGVYDFRRGEFLRPGGLAEFADRVAVCAPVAGRSGGLPAAPPGGGAAPPGNHMEDYPAVIFDNLGNLLLRFRGFRLYVALGRETPLHPFLFRELTRAHPLSFSGVARELAKAPGVEDGGGPRAPAPWVPPGLIAHDSAHVWARGEGEMRLLAGVCGAFARHHLAAMGDLVRDYREIQRRVVGGGPPPPAEEGAAPAVVLMI